MDGIVLKIVMVNSDLYVGGNFTTINSVNTGPLARWNNNAWYSVFPSSAPGEVNALYANNGTLYVGGNFSYNGGTSYTNAAEYQISGNNWTNIVVCGGTVYDFIVKDQYLFIGGDFIAVGNPDCTTNETSLSFAGWDMINKDWDTDFMVNSSIFCWTGY